MMVPTSLLEMLSGLLQIGKFLAAFPLDWDSTRREASFIFRKLFYVRWCTCVFYISVNTAFMAVRFVQAASFMQLDYGRLFMNLFNVITWSMALIAQTNSIIFYQDILAFINTLMTSSRSFKSRK